MSLPLSAAGAVVGEALELEGERLMCAIEHPLAPGAPVTFTVTLDGEPVSIRGKSRGSKRRADGRFTLQLRLVNLRRSHREALERALRG